MSQALPPAIIFDLDDTIIADSEMSERCWKEVCAAYSDRIGEVTAETLYEMIRIIRSGNRESLTAPCRICLEPEEIFVRDLLASAFESSWN